MQMFSRTSLLAAAVLALSGATVQAEAVNYAIDPTHTFVTFEIMHFGTSTNRGRFDKNSGSVQLNRAAKSGKVDLTIDMASINTGTAGFDKHLRGTDFFDVEKHPSSKFSAEKFSFNGDKVTEVAGNLTMMGKTNPVVLKASNFNCFQHPMLKREVCGGDFETTIDRTQWGVDYGLKWGFPKDVRLVIQVEAVKQ
jgi:polyisoprenoid-binding protein YceI